jgi:hypothetical protein
MSPFHLPFIQVRKDNVVEPVPALWKGRVLHLMGQLKGESGANHYYQLTRLPTAEIEKHSAKLHEMTKVPQQHFMEICRIAKEDASYWLGLASFDRGMYPAAVDYFSQRTLSASPDGPWTAGATYNLARSYEALGQQENAVQAYRNDESPQRHGNLLRAKWLEEHLEVLSPKNADSTL